MMLGRQPQTIAPTKNQSGVIHGLMSQVWYRLHSYDMRPGHVRTESDEDLKSHFHGLQGA